MHNGPAVVSTASRCAGFRSWVRNLGCTAGRVCHTPPTVHPAIHSRDDAHPGHGASGRVSTDAALHAWWPGSSRYTDDPPRSAAQMAPPPTASSPRAGSPPVPRRVDPGRMHASAPPGPSRSDTQTPPTPAARPVGRPVGTTSPTLPVAASTRATAPGTSKLRSVDRPPAHRVAPSVATLSARRGSRTGPRSRLVAASIRARPWPPWATQTMRPATARPAGSRWASRITATTRLVAASIRATAPRPLATHPAPAPTATSDGRNRRSPGAASNGSGPSGILATTRPVPGSSRTTKSLAGWTTQIVAASTASPNGPWPPTGNRPPTRLARGSIRTTARSRQAPTHRLPAPNSSGPPPWPTWSRAVTPGRGGAGRWGGARVVAGAGPGRAAGGSGPARRPTTARTATAPSTAAPIRSRSRGETRTRRGPRRRSEPAGSKGTHRLEPARQRVVLGRPLRHPSGLAQLGAGDGPGRQDPDLGGQAQAPEEGGPNLAGHPVALGLLGLGADRPARGQL